MAIAADAPTATTRSAADLEDAELVARVRRGDVRAFELLYERYHRRIASYVLGMVRDHGRAEDVTQEVFISALRRMQQTDRPILFKPWIYEIAKNACIDQFRRSRRAEEVSYDADGGLAPEEHLKLASRGAAPEAQIEAKQRLDDLRGAFGGLSESHHEILVMRELEGLSYREIGERLGMTRPSVESTLFRARRRLTEEYEELSTGERCQRVQGLILKAVEGSVGTRDGRTLGRHVAHCSRCRRQARLAGLEIHELLQGRLRSKLLALLPLPAFLRRGSADDAAGVTSGLTGASQSLAQWSPALAHAGEAGTIAWMKAAAAAATIAVAGTGAGAVGGPDDGMRLGGAVPGGQVLVAGDPADARERDQLRAASLTATNAPTATIAQPASGRAPAATRPRTSSSGPSRTTAAAPDPTPSNSSGSGQGTVTEPATTTQRATAPIERGARELADKLRPQAPAAGAGADPAGAGAKVPEPGELLDSVKGVGDALELPSPDQVPRAVEDTVQGIGEALGDGSKAAGDLLGGG